MSIPPGSQADLWSKSAEDGSGAWQELGAGEEGAFWLKIMPGEAWLSPEAASPAPLGGRVTLPGHQPRLPGAAGPGPKAEQGRNPPGARINHPASPGAQINHPAVFHSPGCVFTVYTA